MSTRFFIREKDIYVVLSVFVVYALIQLAFIHALTFENLKYFIPFGFLFFFLFLLAIELYRRNEFFSDKRFSSLEKQINSLEKQISFLKTQSQLSMNNSRRDYLQTESLLSIYATLRIDQPLPEFRGWAASPDFSKVIMTNFLSNKPVLTLELGSGVSSVILGYSAKKVGGCKIISLEHDEKFFKSSKSLIELHGLSDYVEIVHAPLKKYTIKKQNYLWYDLHSLKKHKNFDMLIIDGPPGHIQEMSRYPAIPLLKGYLSRRCTIIMDDMVREDEQKAVSLWIKENGISLVETPKTEKGTVVLLNEHAI